MNEFISDAGNIKLYNADCMEIMAKYPDKYFDLAVVDPPYGLGASVVNSGGRFKRYHNKNGNWDLNIPNKEYFKELFRISKNQIIWGGNYFSLPPNKCFIIWDKEQPQGISFAMCEYAWTSFDKVAQIYKNRVQGQPQRFHPTAKPKALYNWIFKNYSEPTFKVFDSHLGSASSAISAHYFGFTEFVGCEIDTEYFEKSIIRFKHETAQLKLF